MKGQTVVVIGGSSGIGLETARRARSEGAEVVITGRNPERLDQAARELGARSSEAFEAADFERLDRFLDGLPAPVDHVMLTAGGPYYARLADIDFAEARRNVEHALWLPLHLARRAMDKVRPGGSLLFVGGTGGRRADAGPIITTFTAAMPALTRSLALELGPIRVNLIAAGFVDTPLSANSPRRRTGGAARTTARDAADPAGGRAGRRGGPRGPPDDEHGCHWSDVRHRRRSATDRLIFSQEIFADILTYRRSYFMITSDGANKARQNL